MDTKHTSYIFDFQGAKSSPGIDKLNTLLKKKLLKTGVQFRHHEYSNDDMSNFQGADCDTSTVLMGERKYVPGGDQILKELILWCSFPW